MTEMSNKKITYLRMYCNTSSSSALILSFPSIGIKLRVGGFTFFKPFRTYFMSAGVTWKSRPSSWVDWVEWVWWEAGLELAKPPLALELAKTPPKPNQDPVLPKPSLPDPRGIAAPNSGAFAAGALLAKKLPATETPCCASVLTAS
jgi:hypothetical protein